MDDFYSKNADQLVRQYESVDTEKVHESWSQFIPYTKSMVLDIGAGSGRDAAWLADMGHEVFAVEPAQKLRKKAEMLHSQSNIYWMDDTLPALSEVYTLGFKFDLILINAVWMHIAPKNRERAFRKMTNLLKPGGKIVISLRHGPWHDERKMYPANTEELHGLAKNFALDVVLDTKTEDKLGRAKVSWSTVVLWFPDDGTGSLPLLRHVIVNDAKSSTYKLALLRILLRIADGAQGAVVKKDENYVTLPFGLVALYWIKAFKPLVLDNNFLQEPSGRYGFAKGGFRGLSGISPFDLRIGAAFKGEISENLVLAINEAKNTIKRMPAFYITWPNSKETVFVCETKTVRKSSSIELNLEYLLKFGFFKVPRILWESMSQFTCWIEPAIINEWCNLMMGYDEKAGNKRSLDEYRNALLWLEQDRNTTEIRAIFESLKSQGKQINCVWTNKKLKENYEIDHCFPFSYWANNDLWNMMPSHPRVNLKKSNRLPSADLLINAKKRIIDWWDSAYGSDKYYERFYSEAVVTLPMVKTFKGKNNLNNIFEGLQNQRIRLKTDQQLAEWSG